MSGQVGQQSFEPFSFRCFCCWVSGRIFFLSGFFSWVFFFFPSYPPQNQHDFAPEKWLSQKERRKGSSPKQQHFSGMAFPLRSSSNAKDALQRLEDLLMLADRVHQLVQGINDCESHQEVEQMWKKTSNFSASTLKLEFDPMSFCRSLEKNGQN